ncbi:hypothetical protein Misp01_82510 [Microtetraspora sp. NBRC 13810]|uniref:hypothetical protein n=1 Tax=Microtetraspora sp. NBRC 13810 TaxID=3030990 RepID=UPI0024A0C6C3|nr:hypothetical protein [Microtetraspora sp. NBRC 13810]GLW13123.1 hypothetical protein Misp01_82510 [Microtetraspora sp. NBRC 13810]
MRALRHTLYRTAKADPGRRFHALMDKVRYTSFEEMLDAEGSERVNPTPRARQLANIRRIYGPENEALGVLAVEIELLGQVH